MQKFLQPLLASEDFATFKSMMVQKNIDFEVQALMLLQKQLGQSLNVYQRNPLAKQSPTLKEKLALRDAEEEKVIQDVLEQSKKESDLKKLEEDQEMERLLELAIQESLKLHKEPQLEEEIETSTPPALSGDVKVEGCAADDKLKSETKKGPDKLHKSGEPPQRDLIPLGKGCAAATVEEMTGEQAAQMWIQSAKSELESKHSPHTKHRVSLTVSGTSD